MKARAITTEEVLSRVTRAAVIRTMLVMMLIQRNEYGFGTRRLEEFFKRVDRYADQYLSYAKGCCGDEKLLRDLEKAGVKIPQQIRNELLSAEREAYRQLTKQEKFPVPENVPSPFKPKPTK